MKPILIVLLSFGLLALSCTDRDDEVNAVFIRIKNASNFTYDEVQVGEQDSLHTNIAAGDYSDYLPYEIAYRYAFISIKAADMTYTLQPIDFVGETELPLGFYTYELGVVEEGEVLLTFVPD